MYIVYIRNNETNEERFYPEDMEWQDHFDYLWSDGNYGCDCNRGLFFARAGEEPDPDWGCGHEKYSVRILDNKGEILYED